MSLLFVFRLKTSQDPWLTNWIAYETVSIGYVSARKCALLLIFCDHVLYISDYSKVFVAHQNTNVWLIRYDRYALNSCIELTVFNNFRSFFGQLLQFYRYACILVSTCTILYDVQCTHIFYYFIIHDCFARLTVVIFCMKSILKN